jgi:Lon protease-like protein
MADKERPSRIPLFPLDVVLLPGMPLPLHIFEPRYKLMVGRCLNEKIEFGMILATSQGIASVGCTAEIVRKLRDYSDGRMDIIAEGRSIFRLDELLDEKEYYEGRVAYIFCWPALPGRAQVNRKNPFSPTAWPRSFPWNSNIAKCCLKRAPKATAATCCCAGSAIFSPSSKSGSASREKPRATATRT